MDVMLSNKGQSAIEYLMTYGWMLLVVAVVGGLIFSLVSGESIESVSFSGGDVEVSDFSFDEENNRLDMVIRNAGSGGMSIEEVTISDEENSVTLAEGVNIPSAEEEAVSLFNIQDSSGFGSDELDIEVIYSSGGLQHLSATGTLTGQLQVIEDTVHPALINDPSDTEPSDLSEVMDNMNGSGSIGDPYVITNDHELQAMGNDLEAYYELEGSIDASKTSYWNDGEGFEHVGEDDNRFEGGLDGNGYAVYGLSVNRPDQNEVGLIGYAGSSSDISNLGVYQAEIYGNARVGTVVGRGRGSLEGISVENSEVHAGSSRAGGIVGQSWDSIVNSYVSGGSVYGGSQTGGIVGRTSSSSSIIDSYAITSVEGSSSSHGGLVGHTSGGDSDFRRVFSAGFVQSGGGLIGSQGSDDEFEEAYWDIDASAQSSSDGGEGLTTEQMTDDDAEENMDFNYGTVWVLTNDYPQLR